jgi:hypothetical protein
MTTHIQTLHTPGLWPRQLGPGLLSTTARVLVRCLMPYHCIISRVHLHGFTCFAARSPRRRRRRRPRCCWRQVLPGCLLPGVCRKLASSRRVCRGKVVNKFEYKESRCIWRLITLTVGSTPDCLARVVCMVVLVVEAAADRIQVPKPHTTSRARSLPHT